jgi:hypothetical protein
MGVAWRAQFDPALGEAVVRQRAYNVSFLSSLSLSLSLSLLRALSCTLTLALFESSRSIYLNVLRSLRHGSAMPPVLQQKECVCERERQGGREREHVHAHGRAHDLRSAHHLGANLL